MTATPTLFTERLMLRPLARSVAPANQPQFDNTNHVKYQAVLHPRPNPADGAESFVRLQLDQIAAGAEIYQWVLVLRYGDGEAIGNIHFRPHLSSAKGNRGLWLAEPYCNRGLMSEAIDAVNTFAFVTLGVDSFYVCNVASNVASRRVKQKTAAEFIGFIELAHHNGESRSEQWIVTRANWLRNRSARTR
jgi:ribosomal-protein-alanine N-acetyltransferase